MLIREISFVANYHKHEYVHHFHARVRNYVRVDRRVALPCFFSIIIRRIVIIQIA